MRTSPTLVSTVFALVLSGARAQNNWGADVTEPAPWGATSVAGWGATPTAAAGAASSDAAEVISPSGAECHWHIDHYDCAAAGSDHDHEHGAEEDNSDCVIHVGHHHGNCSPEQLANCDTTEIANYNMPLHIGAIFIILVTSALGVIIPLVSGRRKGPVSHQENVDAQTGRGRGIMGNVFFVAKHFGTGIILSTAFIHLLFHGFIMFANECIGHMSYEATAPAIALAAAFFTFLLDFLGHRHMAKHAHHAGTGTVSPSNSREGGRDEKVPRSPGDETPGVDPQFLELGHDHHAHLAASDQKWQVLVLEVGILFHSIMIGVTLGASGGNGWTTLLIVIVFHQFFEGLALGARIALLPFTQAWKPWVMGAAFIAITPIGIAIGVGVHEGFAANGKAALLSVGILNSISAGILLYAAFDLLANDWCRGALRTAPWSRVILALISLVAGLIGMSVLGKWA